MYAELLVDMAGMGLDGAIRQAQLLLDEHAAAALGEKGEDLGFTRGKARPGGNALASVAHVDGF